MTPAHELFWDKQTRFICKECGYEMTPLDHNNVKRGASTDTNAEMDFGEVFHNFTCPQCGTEAIVLW